jgi:hypothetical protein
LKIVNWELRRSKDHESRWRAGSQLAKSILVNSDPSRRYWKTENAQRDRVRISNANWVAHVDILAQSVTPLKTEDTEPAYPWLLAGSERDNRKIHGSTGVCPKILHTFAQITHLTALMAKVSCIPAMIDPSSYNPDAGFNDLPSRSRGDWTRTDQLPSIFRPFQRL